jgi:hypothetical protein
LDYGKNLMALGDPLSSLGPERRIVRRSKAHCSAQHSFIAKPRQHEGH